MSSECLYAGPNCNVPLLSLVQDLQEDLANHTRKTRHHGRGARIPRALATSVLTFDSCGSCSSSLLLPFCCHNVKAVSCSQQYFLFSLQHNFLFETCCSWLSSVVPSHAGNDEVTKLY